MEDKNYMFLLNPYSTIETGVIPKEHKLARHSVVGKRDDGKLVLCNSKNTDGSEIAGGILRWQDGGDASDADRATEFYVGGTFSKAMLVFGGNDTHAMHEAELEGKGD